MCVSFRLATVIAGFAVLTSCAAHSIAHADPVAPGFLLGLWHGAIAPIAFVVSLFNHDVAVYAVPNKGWPYNLGFLIGVGVWAGGSTRVRRSKSKP